MAERQIIPADQILPNKLLILAITGKPIFPGIFTPVMIHNPDDIALIDQAVSANSIIGMVLTKTEEVENANSEDLQQVGTVAKIVRRINLPDGGINVFISTLKRFQIVRYLSKSAPVTAAVEYLDEFSDDTDEAKALTRALISEMKQVSEKVFIRR